MTIESERIKAIHRRWTTERKVSSKDVEWLLEQAEKAETFRAAGNLRNASRSNTDRIVDDLLGGFGRR